MAASPIIFAKGTTPATPAAGKVALYVDASGVPHYVDETGTDSALIDPTAASAAAASASASETAAAVSASAAASSQVAAEAAADVAQLSAGVYADTTAGLAATTSGQYFSVPSADSAEYLILYKNNAGSAVEVKRYPSAAAVDAITATGIADYYVDSTGALRKRVASILGGYDAAWFEVAGGVYQDVAAAVPADTTGQAVSRIPVHTAGALAPDLTPLVSTHDVTGWTKAATTVTADTDAGHDGATLADKVSETATTAVHGINKSLTKVVGRRYRYTAIVKPAGRTKVRVYLSSTRGVDFDLTTKTVIASVGYGEASDAGNGYVRLDVYCPAAATAEPAWLILLDASGASSYAGDGTSGVLVSSIEVSAAEADFVPFTTAGRPEYRGDCVRFNGTSHNLVGSIPPLTGATKAMLVMAIRHTSPTGTGALFETTNPVASSGGFGAYLNNGVAGAVGGGMGMNASAYLYNITQAIAPPETYTVAITYDPSGATDDDKVRVRINGADVDESASGSASTGSITSAALGLYGSFLGSRAGTSIFAAFDLYAFALVKGELSAQDFRDLDATFKSRAAITASAPIAGNYTLTPAAFSESAEPVNTGAYYRPSTFAATEFQTEATSLTVNLYNTIYSTYPTFTTVGVYIDGDYNQTIAPTSAGSTSHTITLPAGNKLVSLVGGLQSRPSTAAPPIGTFVVSVAADQPMQQVFRPATNRFIAYGDSIAAGGNATNPDQNGWVMRVRAAAYPASVALEGWGSRSLHEDCNTPELRKAFVNKLTSYGPATIWLAIGTNDYALNKWSAVDFGTAYAAVLDDLHARLPNARIYCQTPLVRTTEAANTFGNTTGDYRAQIATAVSSRTAYATLIDGTAILTTGDLEDGAHPTTVGHGKYGDYVIGVLGL